MSDLSLAEYRAFAEFRHQLDGSCTPFGRAVRDAGLPPSQYQLMLALKLVPKHRHPDIIAERLQTRYHAVLELMGRLERRHLIQRRRDRYDRRVVHGA
jgi:DNA-binding MarR family transcriptional regulator